MSGSKSVMGTAKSTYVSLMQGVVGSLVGSDAKAEATDRDDRLKHWAVSLPRVWDSLAIAKLDVPWWTYRAIDVVDAWLQGRTEPVSVYEYGSGASTIWLAKRAARVQSVEHHRQFGELMTDALSSYDNVTLRIVEPVTSSTPVVASGKHDHEGLDFADYVNSIESAEGPFDVIVIDGRAREACLAKAVQHLAPEGIIIYDNSARRRYREPIKRLSGHERRLRGLTPTLPYPEQTSIITL